jgi:hypothetical protein
MDQGGVVSQVATQNLDTENCRAVAGLYVGELASYYNLILFAD